MIRTEGLGYNYEKNKPLLSGLDLEVKKGSIYGLLGLNGAGKTTLLKLLTGQLFPKVGTCSIAGEEPRFRKPSTMSQFYLVPETFELPSITGAQFINLYGVFYPNFDEQKMEDLLNEFDLDSKKKLTGLSYGQQKKFYLAFAISANTEYLILDEPTNGMDIPSKSQFRKVLAALELEERSILISTHQVRDLGQLLDHIMVLKDGKIVFDHSMERVSQRLSLSKINAEEGEQMIYGEEVLGGYYAILPFREEKEQDLDLELLFNGIIQETERIRQEFKEANYA